MILERTLWLAATIAVMLLAAFAFFYLFRLIFSYEIRDRDILVRLFHFLPLYKVPYNKIVAMRVAPVWEVALVPGMHLPTRPLATRRVAIEMKDRWFIFAFFTPDDPDAFIAEVKSRMTT
ncbi:hypothetical protein [Methylocystis sp.]|uniref:hypothetical protein n=1 Tax=Methylocystis sp. TaxID=1911079 RepID=UPI0025D68193|nr:hypothetical protein [Methylocystis sp.]